MKKLLLILFVSLLLSGCGRKYTIIGRVIFINDTPASVTEVSSKNQIPSDVNIGVASAKVTLFHELNGKEPDRQSQWQVTVEADNEGYFEVYDYATPGNENLAGLEINANGYENKYITYVDYHEPDEQYFVVYLVKRK